MDLKGPLAYKEITGDFVVTTRLQITSRHNPANPDEAPNRSFSLAGIFARNCAVDIFFDDWKEQALYYRDLVQLQKPYVYPCTHLLKEVRMGYICAFVCPWHCVWVFGGTRGYVSARGSRRGRVMADFQV